METPPGSIEYERLSARSLWTIAHIALPISAGLSPDEVAKWLGKTPSWVAKRRRELRREIEALDAERPDAGD